MWAQTHPSTLKMTIFDEMRKLGADYVEAHYSGGNDEGGLDQVLLYCRAAPRKRKDVHVLSVNGKPTKMQGVAVPGTKYLDYNHPLYEALEELLQYDFGSFAGEFRAYGVIYADLPSARLWREGEVSTYSSDESAGEW